ncbi:MAG: hypothetical protein U0Q16_34725 [Bryobacteraceae bacterium]
MINLFQSRSNNQRPLTVQDLDGKCRVPLTVEENLALAFKAVAYAKERCPRSSNQTYIKTFNPSAEKERAAFLVRLARYEPADPFRKEMARKVKGIVGDPNLTQAAKNEQIDRIIKGLKNIHLKGANGVELFQDGADRLDVLDSTFAMDKLLAYIQDQPVPDWSTEKVKNVAQWAEEAGAGNCGEKSALTVEYLRSKAPSGCHIAWLAYDRSYKNGDHAFCVIGTAARLTNGGMTSVGQWGDASVLVDGWMNDAYPAQHPFAWKYGYNYNGVRINPKQMAVRTKLCVQFRDHIVVRGSWTT